MKLLRFLAIPLLAAMVPGVSGAQETRAELIEQAMNAFDPSAGTYPSAAAR